MQTEFLKLNDFVMNLFLQKPLKTRHKYLVSAANWNSGSMEFQAPIALFRALHSDLSVLYTVSSVVEAWKQ